MDIWGGPLAEGPDVFGFSGAKKPPPLAAEAASEVALVPTGLDLGIPARGGGGGAQPLPRPAGGPPGPRPAALGAGPGPLPVGAEVGATGVGGPRPVATLAGGPLPEGAVGVVWGLACS